MSPVGPGDASGMLGMCGDGESVGDTLRAARRPCPPRLTLDGDSDARKALCLFALNSALDLVFHAIEV